MPKVSVNVEYKIGDTVYYQTDIDALPRQITGYVLRENMVVYITSCTGQELYAYAYELTDVNPSLFGAN